MDFEIINPDPSGTVASLRSLGYSVEAAIADLLDNSVAAGSRHVNVAFTWAGRRSWVAVVDDGTGMSEEQLVTAMTIAGTGDQMDRHSSDLGRFGMGLKTASFSQARQLTVASYCHGQRSVRTWDLDVVRESKEWRLLRGCDAEAEAILGQIGALERGTIVLWRGLHRFDIDGVRESDTETQELFNTESQRVQAHLGMVFVRFLSGRGAVAMTVNQETVIGWDPFLTSYQATRQRPTEEILVSGLAITVTPYILPHPGRLSRDEYALAGGPNGWLDAQGFYVFRRNRLILAGDWLGLRGLRRDEKFNFARISVDVPAELDAAWAVDVRKSSVVPPVAARDSLRRIARVTRETAESSVRQRGKVNARTHGAEFIYPWSVKRRNGKLECKINRRHPLVAQATVTGDPNVKALLRLLEETVPVATLRVLHEPDSADDPEPFRDATDEETDAVANRIYGALLEQGSTPNEAKRRLSQMEPFDRIAGFWQTN